MGNHYSQLSLRERCQIDLLRREGLSSSRIAERLGRHRTSIWREVKRNSRATKVWSDGYEPERAHGLALRRRRWDNRHKLARQPELRVHVRDRLAMGWSPEMIAGRLAREHARTIISHESIYRYVYHRTAQKDYWHKLLPRRRFRRGPNGARRGGSAGTIPRRIGIAERPEAAACRHQPGHWEGDLMLFSRYGQAVLAVHERTSRLLVVHRLPGKGAEPVAECLLGLFARLPPSLCRSVTFDNGTEFARHYRLTDRLGIATYFCDTHSPWQKGGIENALGRLRRWLPRKTDLATLGQPDLDAAIRRYNATPRKCLQFKTPAEVFLGIHETLHFNRESSFLPPQE